MRPSPRVIDDLCIVFGAAAALCAVFGFFRLIG